MKKTVRKSIYAGAVKKVNISDILSDVLEDNFDPEWQFVLKSDWSEVVTKKLRDLDFKNFDYITDYGAYWCGVLTYQPFDTLLQDYTEEEILNVVKDEHLKIAVSKDEGFVLEFRNPTASPLYRFFNRHKEDGWGGNVTYSLNVLMNKIQAYLKKVISESLLDFGEYLLYEDEEII